jgi:murein DD-endopeptidase MepM/ murein hydrolase activator NlpD
MAKIVIGIVLLAVCSASAAGCRPATAAGPEAPRTGADIRLAPDSALIAGTVPARTTLAALLAAHAILDPDRDGIVRVFGEVFDVRRMRAGQPFVIDRLHDGRARSFEYEIDLDRRVRVSRLRSDDFAAAIEPIARTTTVATVDGAISRDTPTLTAALDAAGERIELALQLADVFSGEVDFNSDLQPGDAFRVVVERHSRQGGFAGYGALLAAELVNAGRVVRAIRFTPEGGKPAYYDEQGRSLTRFFLKSPLKFEPRITSRFSRARRHPILNYTRAHNGVDYHAPAGAPVGSVAPGVVTMAAWTAGGGRTVRVRHTNGYESEYLHLSAMAVRHGQRVAQGELVGRVGATGLATGPHLHYGLRKHGVYVNPVREFQAMPPGEPVPAAEMALYSIERDRSLELLTRPSSLRAEH